MSKAVEDLQALLVKGKYLTAADVKAELGVPACEDPRGGDAPGEETKPGKTPLVEELQQLLVANGAMTER